MVMKGVYFLCDLQAIYNLRHLDLLTHFPQFLSDRIVGYAVGSNILLMARFDQWPGMTITALAGYVVSNITDSRLTSSTSSAISAFAVGITGHFSLETLHIQHVIDFSSPVYILSK